MGESENKRIRLTREQISILLLVLLALITIMTGCIRAKKVNYTAPIHLDFEGVYTKDDSAEEEQLEDKRFLGTASKLMLRGTFNSDYGYGVIPEGTALHFRLEHINMQILVNGEEVFSANADSSWKEEGTAGLCGESWAEWDCSGLTDEDEVTIILTNGHRVGNSRAFADFLNGMCAGEMGSVHYEMEQRDLAWWLIGLTVITDAIMLIGIALGFQQQMSEGTERLFHWGMLGFCAGLFILMDTIGFALRYPQSALGTYSRQCELMLGSILLFLCIQDRLKEGRLRKIMWIAASIEGGVSTSLMFLALFGKVSIFDTNFVWIPVTMILLVVAAVVCWVASVQGEKQRNMIGYVIFFAIAELELVNAGWFGWFYKGRLIKPTFIWMFTGYLLVSMRQILQDRKKALEAERLKDELQSSRVTLAMSQIKSHFIFNILNAISGMCKYDPEKADETVVCFSRYLRSNVTMVETEELQPFGDELQHVVDYIHLEQIRFGENMLRFQTDIQEEDFYLPPMILQPILENAIKHGLRPRAEGGMIKLSTSRETVNQQPCYVITIADDGVGFEMNPDGTAKNSHSDGCSVGMKNVRFRLEHMAQGWMKIESEVGKGTTTRIYLPESAQPEAVNNKEIFEDLEW